MIEYLASFLLLIAAVSLREYLFAQERKQWTEERAQLLDRIQAPALVPSQRMEMDAGLKHVPFDDDAAFWAAREEMVS